MILEYYLGWIGTGCKRTAVAQHSGKRIDSRISVYPAHSICSGTAQDAGVVAGVVEEL